MVWSEQKNFFSDGLNEYSMFTPVMRTNEVEKKNNEDGIPLMRPLFLMFESDTESFKPGYNLKSPN